MKRILRLLYIKNNNIYTRCWFLLPFFGPPIHLMPYNSNNCILIQLSQLLFTSVQPTREGYFRTTKNLRYLLQWRLKVSTQISTREMLGNMARMFIRNRGWVLKTVSLMWGFGWGNVCMKNMLNWAYSLFIYRYLLCISFSTKQRFTQVSRTDQSEGRICWCGTPITPWTWNRAIYM